MSQILSTSVQLFERQSRKCVERRPLIKIVNISRGDLIKLNYKLGPLGTLHPNVNDFGQWFNKRTLFKDWSKMPKITHNYMKNNFKNLVEVIPRKIHKKIETNLCSGLREVEKVNC